MKLNIEDYNFIAEYETEFGHAVNDNYFRIVNRNLLRVCADIYKRVFNRDSKILNGCNRCVLQDIKALATVYFQDKEEMTKAINEIVDENAENEPKKAEKKATTAKKMSDYSSGQKKTAKNNNKKK